MTITTSNVTLTWHGETYTGTAPCGNAIIPQADGNLYDFHASVWSDADTYTVLVEKADGSSGYGAEEYSAAEYGQGDLVFRRYLTLPYDQYRWYVIAYANFVEVGRGDPCYFEVADVVAGNCVDLNLTLNSGSIRYLQLDEFYDYSGSFSVQPPDQSIALWAVQSDGSINLQLSTIGSEQGTYTVTLDSGDTATCGYTLEVLPENLSVCNDDCQTTDWDTEVTFYPRANDLGRFGSVELGSQVGPGSWQATSTTNGQPAYGDGVRWVPDSDSSGFVGVVSREYVVLASDGNVRCCGVMKALVLPPTGTLGTEYCALFVEASLCGNTWHRMGQVTSVSYSADTPVVSYNDYITGTELSHSTGFTSSSFDLSCNYSAIDSVQAIMASKTGFYIRFTMIQENDPTEIRPMFSAKVFKTNFGWDRTGSGKQEYSISTSLKVSGELNTLNAWS